VSDTREVAAARRANKSASAFRTIGEVSEDLDLPPHVLRFWESKFPQLKPLKRGGGRRYYRPEDILLLRRIRKCLYQDGYTIKGVQKLLRETGSPSGENGAVVDPPAPDGEEAPSLFPLAPVDPDAPVLAPPSLDSENSSPRTTKAPRRLPSGELRRALEELRDELLAARELLDRFQAEGDAKD